MGAYDGPQMLRVRSRVGWAWTGHKIEGMLGKRQFSLGFLILEIFFIALAVGLIRNVSLGGWNSEWSGCAWLISAPIATAVIPIAIGGLFGKMRMGARWGLVFFALYLLFLRIPPH
jgi:hypothetical protein